MSRRRSAQLRFRQRGEALLQHPELYRVLVETMNDGLGVRNADGDVVYVNHRFCEMLGYEEDELIGRPVTELFDDESRLAFEREGARRRAGASGAYEADMLHKSGRRIPTLQSGKAILGEDGSFLGSFAVISDLTSLREATRKLQLTQFAIDKSADAAFWIGPDGNFLYVNDAACLALGYTREELLLMSVTEIDKEFTVPRVQEVIELIRQRRSATFESKLARRDGSIFPVEVTINYREFEGQEYFFAFARDMTQRVRMQAALQESEDRFRDLIENSPAMIALHDLDGRILSANRELAHTTGYSVEELVGRNLEDLVPAISRERLHRYLSVLARRGRAQGVTEIITREGDPRIWEFRNTLRSEGVDRPLVRGFAVDVTERVRAETALRLSEERYRHLFEGVPVGVYRLTPDGIFIDVNPAAVELLGFRHREELLGSHSGRFYADAADRRTWRRQMDRDDVVTEFETRIIRRDGSQMWVRSKTRALRDERGQLLAYEGTIEDITARKEAEDALRRSEERFRSLVQHASDLITIANREAEVLYDSPSHERLLGYSLEERQGRSLFESMEPADRAEAKRLFRRLVERPGSTVRIELRVRHRDGSRKVLEAVATNLLDNPSVRGVVINSRDVTDRKQAEEQLLHDAFHDPLTSLPNRALFMDRMGHALGRTSRLTTYRCAVLFLDLDRFKTVNDSLGHAVGDELLGQVAWRLKRCLRPTDTLARLGGDEFGVLLEDVRGAEHAVRVAKRILEVLKAPLELEARVVYTSASIGIALSTTSAGRPEELLRDADTAMYRAKSEGRARYAIFDDAMHAEALRQLQMETDLRRALESEQLEVFYQPIVSLADGEVAGFEALARWQHPDLGLLAPSCFIPIAEETGLIKNLGDSVLAAAWRQAQNWPPPAPGRRLFVSVNLSAHQLAHPDLPRRIEGLLERMSAPATTLVLELTESSLTQSPEGVAATLEKLKALGPRLSLDHFGSERSSLSTLHRFPFDIVKIAPSIIASVGTDTASDDLVKGVLGFCHARELVTVAQGVERAEQQRRLHDLGCQMAQGFLFSPPLPAAEAAALIRRSDGTADPSSETG